MREVINNIDLKFKSLKDKNEKALVTFITAGDPNLDITYELILKMEKSGADIIELGIPYSDPLADGEVIQLASERALMKGTNIQKIFNMLFKVRKVTNIPIVFLMYYNSLFKYGIEKFLVECKKVKVDGIVIPDIPIEERDNIIYKALKEDIYLIPLVARTSKERVEKITKQGRGFVYCVSVNGVTGARENMNTDIESYMNLVKSYTSIPTLIGFGISNASTVRKLKPYCDGVIIGSAIVKKVAMIGKSEKNINLIMEDISEFIKDIKKELKQ